MRAIINKSSTGEIQKTGYLKRCVLYTGWPNLFSIKLIESQHVQGESAIEFISFEEKF